MKDFLHVLTTWFTFLVGAQSNAFKASNLEAVGAGGAGGNMPLPKIFFGKSVIPISTRGAAYDHHITTGPP